MKLRNLKLFYWHQAFFAFTDSIWSIAFPLFLYKTFHSISVLFVWSFVWNVIFGLLFLPVFNLAMKLEKPKYFMALGVVFYGISLALMGKISPDKLWLTLAVMLTFAFYMSFYWMTRHWFFSVNADHVKIGKQISWLAILNMAVQFLGPIAGGALSFWISFDAAFLLGSIGFDWQFNPHFSFSRPAAY